MASSNRPSPSRNRHAYRAYRLMLDKLLRPLPPPAGDTDAGEEEDADVDMSVYERAAAVVYTSPVEGNHAVRQMFYRIGFVKSPKDCRATREHIREIVGDVCARSADSRLFVESIFIGYADGPRAVCGPETPLCGECVLTGLCRHFRRRPTIKELPRDERPRERLTAIGEECLSDAELLGIIIRDGTPEASAVDLARKLLARYGDFRNLATKTISELSRIKGIGPAKAAQVKAAMAIARRFATTPIPEKERALSSRHVFDYMHERLRDKRQETFHLLLLDSKNQIIRDLQVSAGSLSSSLIHPREVFAPAIRESAASVIFVHNHPSGDPTPSPEDVDITRRLRDVSDLVGIKVLDHVIIGAGRYVSLKEKRLL